MVIDDEPCQRALRLKKPLVGLTTLRQDHINERGLNAAQPIKSKRKSSPNILQKLLQSAS